MTPPLRIIGLIELAAAEHETTTDRVLDGDKATETVAARRQAITQVAKTPKPSGRLPGVREIARWFNMSGGQVSRIIGT